MGIPLNVIIDKQCLKGLKKKHFLLDFSWIKTRRRFDSDIQTDFGIKIVWHSIFRHHKMIFSTTFHYNSWAICLLCPRMAKSAVKSRQSFNRVHHWSRDSLIVLKDVSTNIRNNIKLFDKSFVHEWFDMYD